MIAYTNCSFLITTKNFILAGDSSKLPSDQTLRASKAIHYSQLTCKEYVKIREPVPMIGLVSNARMYITGNSGRQGSEKFIVFHLVASLKINSPQVVDPVLNSPRPLFILAHRKEIYMRDYSTIIQWFVSDIQCKAILILSSTNSTCNNIPLDATRTIQPHIIPSKLKRVQRSICLTEPFSRLRGLHIIDTSMEK